MVGTGWSAFAIADGVQDDSPAVGMAAVFEQIDSLPSPQRGFTSDYRYCQVGLG